jgi:hypothetical protein
MEPQHLFRTGCRRRWRPDALLAVAKSPRFDAEEAIEVVTAPGAAARGPDCFKTTGNSATANIVSS